MNPTRRSSVRLTSASQRRFKPGPEPALKKFMKIILLSTIQEKMMKIPPRFVRLGPKLSDNVTIETPVGFKRSIRIKRIGDEVWFEKGWNEFAEAHCLSEGHFLYFQYNGNSSFRVLIFDLIASEIDYPLDKAYVIVSSDDDEDVVDDDDDDDDVMEVKDDNDEVMEVKDDDEVKEDDEAMVVMDSENDSSEGVIDLDEMLKKKARISNKSEKITIIDDDVEEIDSMVKVREDTRVFRRSF